MARLIIDLSEAEKKAIQDFADEKNQTIKKTVLEILGGTIKNLKKEVK